LAQLATGHGGTAEGLQKAVTDAVSEKLDQAVAATMLTAAQKQTALDRLPKTLPDLIQRKCQLAPCPHLFMHPQRIVRRTTASYGLLIDLCEVSGRAVIY